MPIGVPMTTPMTVRMRLPTMALARPPALPGGGVLAVNTSSDRPENPFHSSVARMTTSHDGAERRGGEREDHR